MGIYYNYRRLSTSLYSNHQCTRNKTLPFHSSGNLTLQSRDCNTEKGMRISLSSLLKFGKKRHKEKKLVKCAVGSGFAVIVTLCLWTIMYFPSGTSGYVIVRDSSDKLQQNADMINPAEDSEIGALEKFVAQKRDTSVSHLKIQNTSDLHIDSHDDRSLNDANNAKSVPSTDYLRKVVVFQKPFHFHVPILSESQNSKRKKEATGKSAVQLIQMEGMGPVVKRDTEAATKTSEEIDELDHLLKQHPRLVPPVNRKRSSGRGEKTQQDGAEDETHAHHLMMGFSLGIGMEQDDDVVGQGESHLGLARKRNAKTKIFSQDLVDDILNHEDDLVKYRQKIKQHSKSLGVMPEDAFLNVVYGNYPEKKAANMSSTNDIYQRRLQFHRLFLDDNQEVEKYHYNEIVEQDKRDVGKVTSPYNPYMKILKRSKRGLKNWIKKIFRRGDATTEAPTTTTTTPPPPPPRKSRKDGTGRKTRDRKEKAETRKAWKEDVDDQGDSQTDKLLPKGLRRSSYLKKKDEAKKMKEDEQRMEEEEEKSEEKEVKQRIKVENLDDEEDEKDDDTKANSDRKDEDENDEEEQPTSKKKGKKENDDTDYEEEQPKSKKKGKKEEDQNDDEEEDEEEKTSEKRKKKKKKKRHGRDLSEGQRRIRMLSKDEIGLLLEMIFNLVEYQCPALKRGVMDGLLQITQKVVELTGLKEYIAERRDSVDELFKEMLDCSSNTQNVQRWNEYQSVRKRQQETRGDFLRKTGFRKELTEGMVGWERPLRRTKRVKKDVNAVELISVITNGENKTEIIKGQVATEQPEQGDEDRMKLLLKLYFLVYQIIGDTCFNLDSLLLHESSLVLIEELKRMRGMEKVKMELDRWAGHYEIKQAEKMLMQCSEQEL